MTSPTRCMGIVAIVGLGLVGCVGKTVEEPNVSGESHWLTQCDATAECDEGGSCLCGACTVECQADADCGFMGAGAVCATSDAGCQVAVCTLPCQVDADCALSDTCLEGVCRPDGQWQCNGTQRVAVITEHTTLVTGVHNDFKEGNGRDEAPDEDCVPVERRFSGTFCEMEGAYADVVLVDGEIAHTVCFPPRRPAVRIAAAIEDAPEGALIGEDHPGMIVSLTPEEGQAPQPFAQDLQIEAERTVIIGDGVEHSVIDGDLTVDGPNARLRSLTLTGDLNLNAPGAAATACRVYGDLNLNAPNATLLSCEILGSVTGSLPMTQAVLINVGVAGRFDLGETQLCDGCYSFEADGPEDLPAEPGAPVCAL